MVSNYAAGNAGQGGYQGQLAGGNGTPNGGQAGANTTSQGQDSPAAGGGARGGGVHGGLAGASDGQGGGAGSSYYASQLIGGTIRVAPNSNNNAGANSEIERYAPNEPALRPSPPSGAIYVCRIMDTWCERRSTSPMT